MQITLGKVTGVIPFPGQAIKLTRCHRVRCYSNITLDWPTLFEQTFTQTMAQNFAATYLLAYLETIACHKQMSDVSEIMLNRIERRDWLEWNLLPPKPITLRALKQLQIRVLQDHICYNTMHGNNKATSFNHGSSNGICRNLGFGPNMIAVITRRMMRMWTQMMSSTFCPGVNPSHIMHAMRRFDNFAPGWFP